MEIVVIGMILPIYAMLFKLNRDMGKINGVIETHLNSGSCALKK